MAKNKYLGEDAVLDLFDIITDNFVTKKEFEAREQSIASSIQVGNAFIAAAILRLAEAVAGVKGGVGGDNDYDFATNEEVDDVFKQYFGDSVDTVEVEPIFDSSVDNEDFATDEEVDSVLSKYFNIGGKENGRDGKNE